MSKLQKIVKLFPSLITRLVTTLKFGHKSPGILCFLLFITVITSIKE